MEIQNVGEEEWEVLDYYCYEEEEDECEKHRWWKMGNWVMEAGKKLVMTGVVISSAPVVLPPLLVVSALGFAMSLPFGFVFASYACTHKLMTKLLPLPPPPVNRNILEEEEMMMMGEDNIMKVKEIRIDLMVDDEHDAEVGGKNNGTNTRARSEEKREMNVMESPPDDYQVSGTPTTSTTSSENENGNIVGEEEVVRRSEEMDSEKKKHQVILMNDDAATSSSSLDKQDNKEARPPPANLDPDHRGDLSEQKMEGDGSSLNGDSDDKELESKIWEKINAIRVIVGFKAPRRSSYVEEVKALYLFTGIDPPSTSELDDNLSFLMSVIGLK